MTVRAGAASDGRPLVWFRVWEEATSRWALGAARGSKSLPLSCARLLHVQSVSSARRSCPRASLHLAPASSAPGPGARLIRPRRADHLPWAQRPPADGLLFAIAPCTARRGEAFPSPDTHARHGVRCSGHLDVPSTQRGPLAPPDPLVSPTSRLLPGGARSGQHARQTEHCKHGRPHASLTPDAVESSEQRAQSGGESGSLAVRCCRPLPPERASRDEASGGLLVTCNTISQGPSASSAGCSGLSPDGLSSSSCSVVC